jgi:cytosine/adenosine deaminase-related metal-dependent hydrolase
MALYKFKADNIFTGTDMLDDDHVLIVNEEGVIIDLVRTTEAGNDIRHFDGMLVPGLVNCHCHFELSHMKGVIPPGTGLVSFLIAVIKQRNIADKENILSAASKAMEEQYNNGTAGVGDICNTADTLAIKPKSKLQFYNFIEVTGFVASHTEQRFEDAKNVAREFEQLQVEKGRGSFHTSVVPHAPYSVNNKLFDLINNDATGKTITVHNQECLAEDELYKTSISEFSRLYRELNLDTGSFVCSGKSSLQTYLPWLNKARNIILVHNTCTTGQDVDFVNTQSMTHNQKIFWCLCVNANLYIEGKLPSSDLLRSNNGTMVIGTDSYASNASLNMLDEIRCIQKHFEDTISTKEILQWATLNGAKALQMDETLGSFEKGKRPGIVFIDNIINQKISTNSSARRIM